MLQAAIAQAAIQLLEQKEKKVYLADKLFAKYFVQLNKDENLASEPLRFEDYNINPKNYDCKEDVFFFVINLSGKKPE